MNDVIGRLLGRLLALVIMAVGVTGVVWPWIQWLAPPERRGNQLNFFRDVIPDMNTPTFMQHWLTTTSMNWCALALGAILYHLVSRPRPGLEFEVE